jgi:hypothetical protein
MAGSSSFAIVEALAVVLVVMFVVALVAWMRYLHHKETMKTLESGGDAVGRLESAKQARMEEEERWRVRNGMMTGVVIAALGLATLGASLSLGSCSTSTSQVSELDYATLSLVLGVGAFLLLVGLASFVANLIWSRQHAALVRPAESAQVRDRRHIHSRLALGGVIAAAGVGCLSALLGGVYANDRGASAVLLGFAVFLLLAGAAIVAVHLTWLRELNTCPPNTTQEEVIDRGDQSAQ